MKLKLRSTRVIVGTVAVAAALAAVGAGTAMAQSNTNDSTSQASSTPTNLDVAKAAVEKYYGVTNNTVGQAVPSPTSAYIKDVAAVDNQAQAYLQKRLNSGAKNLAIAVDIDDTEMTTIGYGVSADFAYGNVTAALAFLEAEKLTAIDPTLNLVNWATSHNIKVFDITDRPDIPPVTTATPANLENVGYPAPADIFYAPTSASQIPTYLSSFCGATCTVVEFKAGTRAHIESEGLDVALTLGDQPGDLEGGFADKAFMLPNPLYQTSPTAQAG